jgi:hypothetical protein
MNRREFTKTAAALAINAGLRSESFAMDTQQKSKSEALPSVLTDDS